MDDFEVQGAHSSHQRSRLVLWLKESTDIPALEEALRREGRNTTTKLVIRTFFQGDLRRWQPERNPLLLSLLRTLFLVERRIEQFFLYCYNEDDEESQIFLPLEFLSILLSGTAASLHNIGLHNASFVCNRADENCQQIMEILKEKEALDHCEFDGTGLLWLEQPNDAPEEGMALDVTGLALSFLSACPNLHSFRWSAPADLCVKMPSLYEWKHILKTKSMEISLHKIPPPTFLEALSSPDAKVESLAVNFEYFELSHCEELARYLQDDPTITYLNIDTKNFPSNMEEIRKLAAVLAEALKANAWQPRPLQTLHIFGWLFPRYSYSLDSKLISQSEGVLEIFAQVLLHQNKLQQFFVPQYLNGTDAAKNIQMYLELNINGRHELLHEGATSSRDWYNKLQQYGDDADRLFCLLRANPNLWLVHVA